MQNLFSIAKTIILYNYNTVENKITIKELEYGKFFKALKKCTSNDSSRLAAKFSSETIYDLNDEDEDVDEGLEKFKHTEIYKEFKSSRGKFIKKHYNFGYFINFERKKTAADYNEQHIFLNKLHEFIDNKCPEIRTKNSQSSYDIYTIKETDNNESNLYLLKKDDPIKFQHRKIHLECQIKFFEHKTKNGKKNDKILVYLPKLLKNTLFTRNLTHGAWEGVEGKKIEDCLDYFNEKKEFNWDIKLDIFQIDERFYTRKDADKYGWIVLQRQNGEKILVNLQPISIGFIGKSYTEFSGQYRKSLRIVTTIRDMKFSHSDGLKPESKWTTPVQSIIKCIFKDVYTKSKEFNSFHNKTEHAPVNITCSLDILKNIVRASQSKKVEKKPKPKPQPKPKPKQVIRHSKPGGYLYLFQHPNWREKQIAKLGKASNWEKRMKQHQTHYPLERILLKRLIRVPHDVDGLENTILAECQRKNCQYNTHATTKSEFVVIGSSLDDIITENLPKGKEEMDIKLWNDVTISDEEKEFRLN